MNLKSLSVFGIILTICCEYSNGVKNISTIIAEMKDKCDRRISPKDLTGNPVTVNVSMFVSHLHAIDETQMEFGFDAYIRKQWNDPRLTYTDGPKTIHFGYDAAKDFIWMPDLFFSRTRETMIHASYQKDAGARIKPNGDVTVSVRATLIQHCQMDLQAFPLDSQQCYFKISTYLSTADDVKLQWYSRSNKSRRIGVYVTKNKFPPGFHLSKYVADHDTMNYSKSFEVLKVAFQLDRLRSHYIVLTYIPSLLLVLISCLLFWLPLSAVVERFLFGSLLILGLTQVLTHSQDQAPQVGYLKAIDVWTVSCYTFLCVALAEVVGIYLISRRVSGTKDDQIELVKNDQLSKGDDTVTRQPFGLIPGSLFEKIDLGLKIVYPVAFLIFNIVYWAVYA